MKKLTQLYYLETIDRYESANVNIYFRASNSNEAGLMCIDYCSIFNQGESMTGDLGLTYTDIYTWLDNSIDSLEEYTPNILMMDIIGRNMEVAYGSHEQHIEKMVRYEPNTSEFDMYYQTKIVIDNSYLYQ